VAIIRGKIRSLPVRKYLSKIHLIEARTQTKRNKLRLQKPFSVIAAIITIAIFLSLAHGDEQEQQDKKTLVSLIHSGPDSTGLLLFNQLKENITRSAALHLASQTDILIIRLEIITFDPNEGDPELKGISAGYAAIWTSTEGYHVMAAAGVCGRDRLQPVASEIVTKTGELIQTAQKHNEKFAETAMRHYVAADLLKENDKLRDRVAELEGKVYKLEMELVATNEKSWWQVRLT
jgi:hypothetical protein